MEFNKERKGTELKFYELTQKIVSDNGYDLYDIEYISGSSTLRVYIMDRETKSALIEDCIKVDRSYDEYCETESWIPDDFVLEVSSPGVYRNLKSREHFEMAKEELIAFTILGKLNEEQASSLPKKLQKANKFRGKLVNVLDNEIVIDIEGSELKVSFEQIKKANLDPDING